MGSSRGAPSSRGIFLIFGWRKLVDFSGTVSRMAQDGAPFPVLSAVIAIFMELPVAFAVAIGAFTRPSADPGSVHAWNGAHCASLLEGQGLANKVDNMEELLQKSQYYRRFSAAFRFGRGKIFGRRHYLDCKRFIRIWHWMAQLTPTNKLGPWKVKRHQSLIA